MLTFVSPFGKCIHSNFLYENEFLTKQCHESACIPLALILSFSFPLCNPYKRRHVYADWLSLSRTIARLRKLFRGELSSCVWVASQTVARGVASGNPYRINSIFFIGSAPTVWIWSFDCFIWNLNITDTRNRLNCRIVRVIDTETSRIRVLSLMPRANVYENEVIGMQANSTSQWSVGYEEIVYLK